MKYVWMALRLLLPIAAVVLAALSMNAQGDTRTALLGGGMACLGLSTVINLYFQRKAKKEKAQ